MKVVIIGCGDVGASSAARIAEANLADVVMLDIVPGKAEARALDLRSAASITKQTRQIEGTDNYEQIAGADIVVVASGQARTPGQSREDLLQNNGNIIKDVSAKLSRYCPGAVVIVVTNPLDVMTYLALKTTGFPANRIIGMGGVSDCARFNMLIAAELKTAASNIQSMIVGAHGDSMVILPRFSTANGKALTEVLPENKIEEIAAQTRHFGARIVKLLGKGSAYFGPSAGVFSLVDSIVNDRNILLSASVFLSGQYGLQDVCIGVPVKVGRTGITKIVQLELN
ncbi:MAG: malate dehydrogenase, partial [Candidatus Omnitrophica bacterium]|nr:malate dehydrogenase [Candidatus Omnitrophota bacterium]